MHQSQAQSDGWFVGNAKTECLSCWRVQCEIIIRSWERSEENTANKCGCRDAADNIRLEAENASGQDGPRHLKNITQRLFYPGVVSPRHTCRIVAALFCGYLQPLQISALCLCSSLPNSSRLKAHPSIQIPGGRQLQRRAEAQSLSTGLMGPLVFFFLMTGIISFGAN